jgi:hypothetical protein
MTRQRGGDHETHRSQLVMRRSTVHSVRRLHPKAQVTPGQAARRLRSAQCHTDRVEARQSSAAPTITARGPVILLGVVVGIVLAFVAGVVLPYYVNDLDRLPLAEVVSGRHDPKELWPETAGPWGHLLHGVGAYAVTLGHLTLIFAAGGSLAGLALLWRQLSTAARRALVTVLAVAGTAFVVMASGWGQALATWTLD